MLRSFSVLAIGVCSAVLMTAQERDMGGIGLTVFADANYRGRNATLVNDVPNLQSIGMNDMISSLRVGPGERWEVCQDSNYRGRCQVFSGTEANLRARGWSDIISSARRVSGRSPGPGGGGGGNRRGLELFGGARYSGPSRSLSGPIADLRRLDFSDRAMSLRIGPNEAWEVCDGTNYRDCRVVNTDWTDLDRLGLSRRISSARPWNSGRGGGGVLPSPPPRQSLVLFDDQRYGGRSLTLTGDTRVLGDFMNRAKSVRVSGGPWELCQGMDFTGRCVTVNRDVSDLDDIGMRSRVVSVRPARAVPR